MAVSILNSIELLYPPLREPAKNLLAISDRAGIPIVYFETLRSLGRQQFIYPNDPHRFTLHFCGLAVDKYPRDYKKWKAKDFSKNLNSWYAKNGGAISDLAASAGFDVLKEWQKSDMVHSQCLFGCSEQVIKLVWNNTKGDEATKLKAVWQYLDAHKHS